MSKHSGAAGRREKTLERIRVWPGKKVVLTVSVWASCHQSFEKQLTVDKKKGVLWRMLMLPVFSQLPCCLRRRDEDKTRVCVRAFCGAQEHRWVR